MNVSAKFEVPVVPVPAIIAIEVLGVANSNLGEEEAVGGRGWYRSKERL